MLPDVIEYINVSPSSASVAETLPPPTQAPISTPSNTRKLYEATSNAGAWLHAAVVTIAGSDDALHSAR